MSDTSGLKQLNELVRKYELIKEIEEALYEMGQYKKAKLLFYKQEVRWVAIQQMCEELNVPLPETNIAN